MAGTLACFDKVLLSLALEKVLFCGLDMIKESLRGLLQRLRKVVMYLSAIPRFTGMAVNQRP